MEPAPYVTGFQCSFFPKSFNNSVPMQHLKWHSFRLTGLLYSDLGLDRIPSGCQPGHNIFGISHEPNLCCVFEHTIGRADKNRHD